MQPSDSYDTGLAPEEYDRERPLPCETPWGTFSIFEVEGRWRAFQSFCPHLLGPLFQGSRSEHSLVCPWHLWSFDLRSGACTFRPEGRECEAPPLVELVVSLSARGTFLLSPRNQANQLDPTL